MAKYLGVHNLYLSTEVNINDLELMNLKELPLNLGIMAYGKRDMMITNHCIIANNLKLLSGMLPSFDMQIQKAENRGDLVSVNHRVTEFLASYFDIIFALNEMTHPGEKRMQTICSKECNILPNNFDANLYRLFDGMFRKNISGVINDMVDEIKKITQM